MIYKGINEDSLWTALDLSTLNRFLHAIFKLDLCSIDDALGIANTIYERNTTIMFGHVDFQ